MTPRWLKFTLGAILGPFWPFLGPFWPPRAPICSAKLFWPLCRPDFSRFLNFQTSKATLSQMTPRWLKFTLGAIFGRFWPFFGPFWPPQAPICSAKRLFWPLWRPDISRFWTFQTSKATLPYGVLAVFTQIAQCGLFGLFPPLLRGLSAHRLTVRWPRF